MTAYLDDGLDVDDPAFVAVYDELPLWSAAFGLLLLKHVPLRRNVTLLDVGCGTGFPLLELAQRLGPSCRAYGIDPWKPAVERARQKTERLRIPNVTLIDADAAAMPFDGGQFDLIVSNLGINNFDRPHQALAECRRVAKPGATLALATNLRGHMSEFYEVFEATLKDLGRTAALDRLKTHVDHRATIESVSEMLQKAGFRTCRVAEEAFSLRFLDGTAMLTHAFIKIGFLSPWRGVLLEEERTDEREVFRRVEANLNRLARDRGGLELTVPMAYVEAARIA